jgi:hypothetical protein
VNLLAIPGLASSFNYGAIGMYATRKHISFFWKAPKYIEFTQAPRIRMGKK